MPVGTQLCRQPRRLWPSTWATWQQAAGPSHTVQQARSAISHYHAATGMQKADNPARHPVVAEAVKGWRNRAPSPKQASVLTADALARVRETLRLPRRGRGGRMESAETAQQRAALDLAIIGVLADGGLRRSEAAALTWGDVELWADAPGHPMAEALLRERRDGVCNADTFSFLRSPVPPFLPSAPGLVLGRPDGQHSSVAGQRGPGRDSFPGGE